MGYSTDFQGCFKLDRPLDEETKTFLTKLATTRRVKRQTSPEYGVDGEFYVDGGGFMGQDHDSTVVDYNTPPVTQPGLWCQWIPNEEGTEIVWDGGEKFYEYAEWLQYIVSRVLNVKNYTLNGSVYWQGEDHDDFGVIEVKDSIVNVKNGRRVYE
jgi:hypothetical protein